MVNTTHKQLSNNSEAIRKRNNRRDLKERRRKHTFVNNYVETKYPHIYVEISGLYENLADKYPGRADLSKTYFFKKWQRETKQPVNQQQPQASIVNQQPQASIVNQQQPQASTVNQQQPQASTVNQQQPQASIVNQQQPQASIVNQQRQASTVNQQQPQTSIVNQQPQASIVNQQQPQTSIVNQQPQASIVNQQQPQASIVNQQPQASSVNQQQPKVPIGTQQQTQISHSNQQHIPLYVPFLPVLDRMENIEEGQGPPKIPRIEETAQEPPKIPRLEETAQEPPQIPHVEETRPENNTLCSGITLEEMFVAAEEIVQTLQRETELMDIVEKLDLPESVWNNELSMPDYVLEEDLEWW